MTEELQPRLPEMPEPTDSELIDWIGRAGDVCIFLLTDQPHDGEFCVTHDLGREAGVGKTVRAAIVAAIRRSPDPLEVK